jgi:predicted membrane chloride channel (bestrophin family)
MVFLALLPLGLLGDLSWRVIPAQAIISFLLLGIEEVRYLWPSLDVAPRGRALGD